MLVKYGEVDYWNKRYKEDEKNPFDWLLDFNDTSNLIYQLIPDKSTLILIPGCGNAPFSPDLYYIGGYTNLINFDNSDVVINQMIQKFPALTWKYMDVLNLPYDDNSIPVIIDKSLIDTLMCYANG